MICLCVCVRNTDLEWKLQVLLRTQFLDEEGEIIVLIPFFSQSVVQIYSILSLISSRCCRSSNVSLSSPVITGCLVIMQVYFATVTLSVQMLQVQSLTRVTSLDFNTGKSTLLVVTTASPLSGLLFVCDLCNFGWLEAAVCPECELCWDLISPVDSFLAG